MRWGRFLSPIRYDAPHGSGYELEDDPSPPCRSSRFSCVLSYATMDYRKIEKEVEKKAGEENGGSSMTKENSGFKEHGIPSGGWGIVLLYGPWKTP